MDAEGRATHGAVAETTEFTEKIFLCLYLPTVVDKLSLKRLSPLNSALYPL